MKTKHRIAHVGHTGTDDDMRRILKVLMWMAKNNCEPKGKTQFDAIDLNKGRDFLREDLTYEVVVLHFVFRGSNYPCPFGEPQELNVSPTTSWSRWRTRLVDTQAKYIFAFGGEGEVSGGYLCTLDGYQGIKIEEEFWVFKKL